MKILQVLILLFLQTTETQGSTLTELLLRSSPIAKAVLILLLIFSVASWAIIFTKWAALRKAEQATREFLERFRSRAKLSDLYVDSDTFRQSPLAHIFLAGYHEITNQIGEGARRGRSLDAISRVLQSAVITEATRLERGLSWLATTANASPFIGLFGTVVGIVIAFQGLSTASASSIQSVAPGIAEALIATAAGIAAAVPAAIFYNYFLNKIKSLTATMDRFSLELLNMIEQNYLKADV
ncbi:MAG TPA: MotA/TolQ/ExbB proton channel family protein [Blastocatellia bacterium]|nr:MotA/TolQ/ExbB proton channel family protein [Blastocatellia bacterium]